MCEYQLNYNNWECCGLVIMSRIELKTSISRIPSVALTFLLEYAKKLGNYNLFNRSIPSKAVLPKKKRKQTKPWDFAALNSAHFYKCRITKVLIWMEADVPTVIKEYESISSLRAVPAGIDSKTQINESKRTELLRMARQLVLNPEYWMGVQSNLGSWFVWKRAIFSSCISIIRQTGAHGTNVRRNLFGRNRLPFHLIRCENTVHYQTRKPLSFRGCASIIYTLCGEV